jgi:hypothetical protein
MASSPEAPGSGKGRRKEYGSNASINGYFCMLNQWQRSIAEERINRSIAELPLHEITIKDYVRDANLHDLPRHVAYRVDGARIDTLLERPPSYGLSPLDVAKKCWGKCSAAIPRGRPSCCRLRSKVARIWFEKQSN